AAHPASRSAHLRISTGIPEWIRKPAEAFLRARVCRIHKAPLAEQNVHSAARRGGSKSEKSVAGGPDSDRAETETCRTEKIPRKGNRHSSSRALRASAGKGSYYSTGAGQSKKQSPPMPASPCQPWSR